MQDDFSEQMSCTTNTAKCNKNFILQPEFRWKRFFFCDWMRLFQGKFHFNLLLLQFFYKYEAGYLQI